MAESAAADGKSDKVANGGGGGGDAAGEGKKRGDQAVAFHELFSFADKWDLMLMAAGSMGALAHGAAMPFFFLLFGDLINGFGKNQTDLRTMTDEVAKVRQFFILRTLKITSICTLLPIGNGFFRQDRCFLSQLSPDLFPLLFYCSTRSTSSTWGWWSASPPTQVTIHPPFLTPSSSGRFPRHILSSPTYHGSFQA
jgi:hypothetical protein